MLSMISVGVALASYQHEKYLSWLKGVRIVAAKCACANENIVARYVRKQACEAAAARRAWHLPPGRGEANGRAMPEQGKWY